MTPRNFFGFVILSVVLTGCASAPKHKMNNPVFYIEIPVENMDRALTYYSSVFGFDLERQSIDGNDMALFPFERGREGATGALAKGDSYKPSKDGSRVYFAVSDIDSTLAKAKSFGGKILYPKTDVGDYGFVAEIEDSEGNRIALHMKKKGQR